MQKIMVEIALANELELDELLKAVLHRYTELLPGREVNMICLEKSEDRHQQLDRIIQMLQKMKESV